MKEIMMAAAVAAFVTAPAFAQAPAPSPGTGDIQAHRAAKVHVKHRAASRHRAPATSAFAATHPSGAPLAETGPGAREAAIRQCNAEAAKTYAVRDSNWSLSMYRACMAQHGQPE
jgi:hypothetical protein